MRPLIPLLLAATLPLAGCLQAGVQRIGVDYYRLSTPYQTRADLEAAVAGHAARAEGLCETGYFKSMDYDRRDGGSPVLIWEIRCDRQFQPNFGVAPDDMP